MDRLCSNPFHVTVATSDEKHGCFTRSLIAGNRSNDRLVLRNHFKSLVNFVRCAEERNSRGFAFLVGVCNLVDAEIVSAANAAIRDEAFVQIMFKKSLKFHGKSQELDLHLRQVMDAPSPYRRANDPRPDAVGWGCVGDKDILVRPYCRLGSVGDRFNVGTFFIRGRFEYFKDDSGGRSLRAVPTCAWMGEPGNALVQSLHVCRVDTDREICATLLEEYKSRVPFAESLNFNHKGVISRALCPRIDEFDNVEKSIF